MDGTDHSTIPQPDHTPELAAALIRMLERSRYLAELREQKCEERRRKREAKEAAA